MLIPECLIRQIVKTWKQLQTIPNSILRPAAGDIWDSAWRLRWNGDDKADRQQKIAYGHYSALQLWIQKNGRCNIREMMVEWLLWQWQKHVPLSPAKSAATGERFGVFFAAKRDHRHGSTGWPPVEELLRFDQDTQIMVKYGEIVWKVLDAWAKRKNCSLFFGPFFQPFGDPCLRLPMDRFWAHESHQLCMEVRQVWNAHVS